MTGEEGSLLCGMLTGSQLGRKGVTVVLAALSSQVEWVKWVDVSSPHARLVWRSEFPSLLIKCIWYALSYFSVQLNVRSVMLGSGAKGYPISWWQRLLFKFCKTYVLQRIVSWKQLSKRALPISTGRRGWVP